MIVLAVAVGGALGTGLRWLADTGLPRPSGFPLGITLVNVLGSFLLGVVAGLEVADGSVWVTPFTAGVLGGFTTYSTWMVDIDRAPTAVRSIVILAIPLGAGLIAAAVGVFTGSSIG